MCCVRFTMSPTYRKEVEHQLKTAQQLGHVRQVNVSSPSSAVMDGPELCADRLALARARGRPSCHGCTRSVAVGAEARRAKKPTGRPPKLTPAPESRPRHTLIDEGPVQAGFRSACWRSPMLQQLMITPLRHLLQRLLHRSVVQEPGL